VGQRELAISLLAESQRSVRDDGNRYAVRRRKSPAPRNPIPCSISGENLGNLAGVSADASDQLAAGITRSTMNASKWRCSIIASALGKSPAGVPCSDHISDESCCILILPV
jgi:hypothetical protein